MAISERLKRFHIRPEVLEQHDEIVRLRRDIHRHPELGFQERRTAGIVAATLKGMDVEVTEGVAETGVVGLIRGARPGPTILVRADMDALPLQEENTRDYVSTVAHCMHACGHDGHVSMALAVARVLARRRDGIAGNVKMVFQPAEEGPGGARPMIDAGVLTGPDVDLALGMHMWNEFPVGHIGVQDGATMAAADHFTLTITGTGGHGAQPQRTVDPIVTAAHVVTALQTVTSRRVDPFQSVVLTVGAIHGGKAHNIIPERVTLDGTVRTMDPAMRDQLPDMIRRIVRGVTDAMAASFELDYVYGYPVTANDPDVCELVRGCARGVLGHDGKVRGVRTMGGEDMAYFLQAVPGCFFFIGCCNAEQGLHFPHHSPRFDFDEDALLVGAELMLAAVERALATTVPRADARTLAR